MKNTLLVMLLLACTCLTGCGGCRQTPAQKAAAAKQEQDAEAALEARRKKLEEEAKKQAPFVIDRLTPLLSERLVATDEGGSLRLAKPGHWATTVQAMKANLADFEGRVTCEAVDAKGQPIALPHTAYRMASSRPAVLAKGRAKRVENELLAPLDVERLQVRSQLVNRLTGREEAGKPEEPWTLMPSHQYFLMVVAREPARYAFLKVTDAVRAPYEDENGVAPPHYRVVLADATKAIPLPSNVLTWTSVAYVVWDEVNLERIDRQQQQALVDWLHWGGRLIVNGPDSLDSLRSSFLADYLPADGGETTTFDADRLAAFSAAWSERGANKPMPPIAVTRPWSGVALKPRPGAVALRGAEGLFYERAVGAGSVVASAVQLSERDLVNWPGFDGFLNGGLLRRPAREFRSEVDAAYTGLQTIWKDYDDRAHDAYFTTPLRWFARDANTAANARNAAVELPTDSAPPPQYAGWGGTAMPETEWKIDRRGGLGEWNEFTPVSRAAREALVTAAGVRVPPASFVIFCLAAYLFVLAPLNWMVFHALNRVEWAWISAPIIALVGTVVVVRQAQLDIGFVRSQTEIGLLELQGDHPRGHLSRYTAIYSSLSSTYDLEFNEGSAVATPFPRDDVWNPAIGDSLSTVAFEKYDRPRLRGMEVSSATTQMVHSEQMLPLKGPIRMFSSADNPKLKQLENKSEFNLADVVVLHRSFDAAGEPRLEGSWVGELKSGSGTLLPWKPVAIKKGELPFAAERVKAAAVDRRKRLAVDPLLELAFRFAEPSDPLYGGRDEWRLVGRIDERLPGVEASPTASQTAGSTVVLAHLAYGPPPPPELDANIPGDVLPDGRRNAADELYDEAAPP